jgi:MFS-type transporter involved in bile tolerance (Atg22 family)
MFSYGTMIAFIATLDPILKSMNYEDSNQTTAITILCAMLIGILATPIFSIIIKKTKKYKLVTSLSKYFVNSRHHRLLRIFGSDNLCIYVESQE